MWKNTNWRKKIVNCKWNDRICNEKKKIKMLKRHEHWRENENGTKD